MRTLHLLNGDCALEEWKKCDIPGEVMVWRENYRLGPLPRTGDITIYNRQRASTLKHFGHGRKEIDIFNELQWMHRNLFSLKKDDKLVLWLDTCPFDRAMQKRLFRLLRSMSERPEIFLVQEDVVWNRENFLKYRDWTTRKISLD